MKQNRPFQDPKVLDFMFEERRNGASLLWLGRKYNVDHTSIMWQCRKYGVVPNTTLIGGRRKMIKIDRYAGVPEEELDALEQALAPIEEGRVNKGKSYREYLTISMQKDKSFIDYFRRYHVNPVEPSYFNRKYFVIDT